MFTIRKKIFACLQRYPRMSHTEVDMIINMLRTIPIKDERPEDMYEIVKRIFPLEDSSVESKTSVFKVKGKDRATAGTHALKIITMHLTGTYDSASATSPSSTAKNTEENSNTSPQGLSPPTHISTTQGRTLLGQDEDMFDSLFQHCLEAVLQHDVFKHPNVLRVTDRWLYVPNTNGNVIVKSIIELLEFLSMPLTQRPETLPTEITTALGEIKGVWCATVVIVQLLCKVTRTYYLKSAKLIMIHSIALFDATLQKVR